MLIFIIDNISRKYTFDRVSRLVKSMMYFKFYIKTLFLVSCLTLSNEYKGILYAVHSVYKNHKNSKKYYNPAPIYPAR